MWAAATAELADGTLPPAAATCCTRGCVVRLAATAPSSRPPALLLLAQGPPAAPACTPGRPAAFASCGGEEGEGMVSARPRLFQDNWSLLGQPGAEPGGPKLGGGGQPCRHREQLQWWQGRGQWQAGGATLGPAQCPHTSP